MANVGQTNGKCQNSNLHLFVIGFLGANRSFVLSPHLLNLPDVHGVFCFADYDFVNLNQAVAVEKHGHVPALLHFCALFRPWKTVLQAPS